MTLITPDEGQTEFGDAVASIELQLRDLKTELEALQNAIRAGEYEGLKIPSRLMSDIRYWLKFAIETEMKRYDRNNRWFQLIDATL